MASKTRAVILPLYSAKVGQHLECAVSSFEAPLFRKGMEGLESVQSRAPRLVRSVEHKSYKEWRTELRLIILEKKRLRRDKVVSGHRLDLMTSKIFSSSADSVIL